MACPIPQLTSVMSPLGPFTPGMASVRTGVALVADIGVLSSWVVGRGFVRGGRAALRGGQRLGGSGRRLGAAQQRQPDDREQQDGQQARADERGALCGG